MASFVQISAVQFRDGLPKGFGAFRRPGSNEIVFMRPFPGDLRDPQELFVVILSGIEWGNGESRSAGEDAIRVALLHGPSDQLVFSGDRVNRSGTVESVMSRVRDRVSHLERRSRRDKCPECGSPLLRLDARDGRPFIGCSGYKPAGCRYTRKFP
ncbi:topoisomerase DNA-binding C4 zinc finger domain-containing protein [Magnetospirillum sp. ME-1]|uniref:topoisomerase DNA-binding C4 zinc finger domain-containing protein n=1 Tax=Magnetospirillum sp. ME-1 TaxID=1639348 RepID=UPI0011AE51A8|nr:topoisomerase DNA-binding C4 zinc finger domain-containing protein [Magnetospirillum sp. ME-1]